MNLKMSPMNAKVAQFCERIGCDPLLVQGAGGNASWKEGETLWIKASGSSLAEALRKDIFIPVDLSHLRHAIERGDFSVLPQVRREFTLRPSIETMLHALMSQPVVLHLHPVEVLAHLVREDCLQTLQSRIGDSMSWVFVDYKKPGAQLAEATRAALDQFPNADIVFLQNHGIVLGGASVEHVEENLAAVTSKLCHAAMFEPLARSDSQPVGSAFYGEYVPIADERLHQLATEPQLFDRLRADWALYPDHVVFLGPRAHVFNCWDALCALDLPNAQLPELVFIRGSGAFVRNTFHSAKTVQLRCYYEVLIRQERDSAVSSLTPSDVADLISWEAEQYRVNAAR
jgi:rhamnose utilization protein RhaD (predicted bifunctional aldolase and dehydrogenase)